MIIIFYHILFPKVLYPKHRIFTSAAQNDTEVSNLLNSFDNKNHALINDIFSGFKYASDKNICIFKSVQYSRIVFIIKKGIRS